MDKLDAEFNFARQALDVRAYRQELLSSNIANADTPGYKARDVDFASALGGALKRANAVNPEPSVSTQGALQLATTSAGHLSGRPGQTASSGQQSGYGQLLYRVPMQPSLDGNTVDLDAERVQFADNTLQYQADVSVVSQQVKMMLAAVTSSS